jgi:DNA-binding NarL/FixJ family response regulator
MAKVIIADDHGTLRAGLAMLLKDIGHEVIAQASNGKELLDQLELCKPDLILMDIQMPVMGGIEATTLALQRYPDLKILILSMFTDESYYNTLVQLGAKGFILKESDHDEVAMAIDTIIAGRLYFSQELLVNLLKKKQIIQQIDLKPREKDILKLLCNGLSSAEIADKLCISTRTVEKSRSELLQKTNTTNSITLAIYAVKNNLIEI